MGNPVRFGKYLLLERIGVGGMAEVFKAKTFGAEGFERLVAIKRILPHLVEDEDFVNMFIDEAKIAVRLQHPNIVGIHDLGRAEGTIYIAMEFVPGRDVRAVYEFEQKRRGTTPIGVGCYIVMKMCEALHHAHFATGPRGEPLQVIHRDVSPQNVLLSFDGEVKVADFGLAKARGRMVQTQAGVVKGKLAYMSPEQLRGDEIDHRVDVFGLGIVLFELLTGTRLFLGPTDMDTLRRVYEARVPPMRELNPRIHPDLEAIVRRALAKDRDARYSTALEMHDDLQYFVYAHDCYAGAAALRNYLREVFPDAAPPPEADLPPFTIPPPARKAPPETFRPPRRERPELVPPPPPLPIPTELPLDAPSAILEELESEIFDALETERPPPPEPVLAQRAIPSGAPDHSGVAPSAPRLPTVPPGMCDDWPTDPLAPTRAEPGPDTNPAPPLEGAGFPTIDWSDDGTTLNTPLVPGPFDDVPLWDDADRTIVAPPDPKRSHGR